VLRVVDAREEDLMTASPRHFLLGKVLLLLVLSALAGYGITRRSAARHEEGEQLTAEQYAADFEAHKAKLTKPVHPIWVNAVGFALFAAGAFGMYEGLGSALGLLIARTGLLPRREPGRLDPDHDAEARLTAPPGRDFSLSIGRTNLLSAPAAAVVAASISVPFWLIWGGQPIWEGFLKLAHPAVLLPLALVSIVVHEGLHGLGFVWSGRMRWRDVRFGVNWRGAAPYAWGRSPLPASDYRRAVVLPCLLLGIVPVVVAGALGSGWLVCFGTTMVAVSVGDLLILWRIRSIDGRALVLDHPSRAGCWVLDQSSEESPTHPLAVAHSTKESPVEALPSVCIDRVRIVFSDGNHNAFTDLCRFDGLYYLCFRSCPDGHSVFATACIVVLASEDAADWREVHRFSVPNRDTRDPHFLVYKDALFVYTGTWLAVPQGQARNLNDHLGYAAWTVDGQCWEGPRMLEGTYGHYIWRAAAWGGKAYLCGRRRRAFGAGVEGEAGPADIEGAMLESEDGLTWRFSAFFTEDHGNETAFLFGPDGSVVAIARGAGDVSARVCRARAPYTEWTRTELDRNVGGPLLAKWGGRVLVGGRKTVDPKRPVTALYWLSDDELHETVELPSGGDNSYPGFVELSEETGLLSFYSSHEGSGSSLAPSAIYLADLSLT